VSEPANHVAVVPNFLGPELSARFYEFALASKTQFQPTHVGTDIGQLNESIRRSLRLVIINDLATSVQQAVANALPRLILQLGIRPFDVGPYEIEMVAHGDGCFYKRHLDTFTGDDRARAGDRMVSCVYYFHSPIKKFTGGELRVLPLPTSSRPVPEYVDIPPTHDTLVAFSSWIPHEVLPVNNSSDEFSQSRFSVNCWVYRQNVTSKDHASPAKANGVACAHD
jgi:SM-20-related protein